MKGFETLDGSPRALVGLPVGSRGRSAGLPQAKNLLVDAIVHAGELPVRLPFLQSSQMDSDDLLALPARCPMSLAVAAASSRRMFCRWASGGVALNRGRGRLHGPCPLQSDDSFRQPTLLKNNRCLGGNGTPDLHARLAWIQSECASLRSSYSAKPNPRFRQFGGKRPVFGMLQLC